jgi:hypothetical protein
MIRKIDTYSEKNTDLESSSRALDLLFRVETVLSRKFQHFFLLSKIEFYTSRTELLSKKIKSFLTVPFLSAFRGARTRKSITCLLFSKENFP